MDILGLEEQGEANNMNAPIVIPQHRILAEGREYTLEFYNPPVKTTFLGIHRTANCRAGVFLYEDDFMREHDIIDVIYMRPEGIEVDGSTIKHTGWNDIRIEPLHAKKDAKKYQEVKQIREAVLAKLN